MKVSDIYFAGCLAAEKALPPESLALIERYDALQRAWRASPSFPKEHPQELLDAGKAIDADPLANAAMELRRMGNRAASAEWVASQKAA